MKDNRDVPDKDGWTDNELLLLCEYADMTNKDRWTLAADALGRSPQECRLRFLEIEGEAST